MSDQRSERVTKLDAARRQLRTAIRLFFRDEDTVAVHTLVGAAHGILRDLKSSFQMNFGGVMLKGKGSYIKDAPVIRPERKRQWVTALNEAQNFFKHARRDSKSILDFSLKETEVFMLDACLMYRNIAARHLREGHIYLIWFLLKYPDVFTFPSKQHFLEGAKHIGLASSDKAFFDEMIRLGIPIPGTE